MRWVAVVVTALATACSNPHNAPISKEVDKMDSLKPVLEKLTAEEKELVAGYVVRHSMGSALSSAFGMKSEPIPDGMTVGKAIEEQRNFVSTQKTVLAAKKAAAEKATAERKALAMQMAQIVGARLTDLSLHKASFRDMDVQSRINFTFEFENKGGKDIIGMKGTAAFKDKFGDVVAMLPLKMETAVPAGKTVTVRLGKDYNQFNDKDRSLVNLEASSVTLELTPDVVLFGDGTKFESPKADAE